MRLLGFLLFASIMLATLKAAIVVLLLVVALSVLWAICCRPREICAFVAYSAFWVGLTVRPTLLLIIVGTLAAIGRVAKIHEEPP